MILYSNGCSWTWGGSLDHLFCRDNSHNKVDDSKRLPLLWPYHLGKLLGAEATVNLADGCGSNQRIVRTTYNWLQSQDKEYLKKVVAVIQLTEWSRFEMLDPLNYEDEWDDHPADWLKCKVDIVNHQSNHFPRKEPDFTELKKKTNNILKNTHPLEHFYRNISYIYALKGMFDAFKIKDYYIWNNSHIWHQWPQEHRNTIFNQFKVLDEVHDSNEFRHSNDFWFYERISEQDGHPSIQGHIDLANIIYDRMKRKGFKA
jgi:hypothetical protein